MENSGQKDHGIAALVEEVEVMTKRYNEAVIASQQADREKMAALRELDKVQKALSEKLETLRGFAPRDSYWKEAERRKDMRPVEG